MKKFILGLLLLPALALGQQTPSQKKYDPPFNLLDNGNFEKKTSGWTNTGGTFAHVITGSNLMFDKGSATFDASATSQYVQTKLYSVTEGLKGAHCMGRIYYKGGDANLVLKVLDGSSNLLGSTTFVAVTASTPLSVTFSCPSSGSVRLRVESTANAAIVALDNAHIGVADNLFKVTQTQFAGSAYYPTTAGCVWSVTNATYAPFPTTAACPAPTIEFSQLGTWQTVDADLPQITINGLPPGMYEVKVQGVFYQTAGSGTVSSFAITDGTTTSGVAESAFLSPSGIEGGQTLVGYFQYTDSGNRTFSMRGAASSSAANISVENFARLQFSLVRYPLSSETALTPDQVANSWSGYHAVDCSLLRANTAYGDPTGDATCTFTQRSNTNFGTVTSFQESGNNGAGIVFTATGPGKYYVCAVASVVNSTTTDLVNVQLTDGSNNELANGEVYTAASGNVIPQTLCGQYEATSAGSHTIKIRTKAPAGTAALFSNNNNPIEWNIFKISQSLPAPLLINSVVSPQAGVEVVARAKVASVCTSDPCTITSQSGNFVSSVNWAASVYTVNFNAGVFSSAPTCVVNGGNNTDGLFYKIGTPSSSTWTFSFYDSASAIKDVFFDFICTGPK